MADLMEQRAVAGTEEAGAACARCRLGWLLRRGRALGWLGQARAPVRRPLPPVLALLLLVANALTIFSDAAACRVTLPPGLVAAPLFRPLSFNHSRPQLRHIP